MKFLWDGKLLYMLSINTIFLIYELILSWIIEFAFLYHLTENFW